MAFTVFFICDCAEAAIKRLSADGEVRSAPAVDLATQGGTGLVLIANPSNPWPRSSTRQQSRARELARLPATKWLDQLAACRRPDPNLPPKSPPSRPPDPSRDSWVTSYRDRY